MSYFGTSAEIGTSRFGTSAKLGYPISALLSLDNRLSQRLTGERNTFHIQTPPANKPTESTSMKLHAVHAVFLSPLLRNKQTKQRRNMLKNTHCVPICLFVCLSVRLLICLLFEGERKLSSGSL
jgi:hypothetical protein